MDRRKCLALFGPAVQFRKDFVPIAGSVTAALLLSQMVHWTERYCGPDGADHDGWFYVPQDIIMRETGLSRRELEGARAKLRKPHQLIEESRGGLTELPGQKNGVVRVRVNFPKILEMLGLHISGEPAKTTPVGLHKRGEPVCTKGENRFAQKGRTPLNGISKEREDKRDLNPLSRPSTDPTAQRESAKPANLETEPQQLPSSDTPRFPQPPEGPGDIPALAAMIYRAHPHCTLPAHLPIPGLGMALIRDRIRELATEGSCDQTDAATALLGIVNELREGIGRCPDRLSYVPRIERYFTERGYKQPATYYTREGTGNAKLDRHRAAIEAAKNILFADRTGHC